MYTLLDEASLISKLKKHDTMAFDKLMNHYLPYVKTIVENTSGKYLSTQDKEEVVADVFVSLWKYAKNIQADTVSIKSYIGAIAKNETKNRIQKLQKDKTILLDDEIFINTESLEDKIVQEEIKKELINTVRMLSPVDAECFVRYYYYRNSTSIISKELGINESTVKTKLARGRKKLKQLLVKRGVVHEDTYI